MASRLAQLRDELTIVRHDLDQSPVAARKTPTWKALDAMAQMASRVLDTVTNRDRDDERNLQRMQDFSERAQEWLGRDLGRVIVGPQVQGAINLLQEAAEWTDPPPPKVTLTDE